MDEARNDHDDEREHEVGDIVDHHVRSPSLAGRRRTPSVRPSTAVDLDRLAGCKGFRAARLPAFALGDHMAGLSRPIHDFGRQAAHRLRADPRRNFAGAPEVAAREHRQPEDQGCGEPDDGPRQLVAGSLDLEQHRRPQQESGEPAEAEDHRRVEGFDDQEADAQQHQGEAGIVDRQRVERVEPEQQADRADHPGATAPGLENSKNRP